MKKLSALFAASALSLTLAACGEADDAADNTAAQTSVAEEVATEAPETDDRDDRDDQDDQPQGDTAQRELPAEVTGYSEEAKSDMAEENVTPSEVERVLTAANDTEPGVEIEWEDDGYWEIDFDGIDIDIDPYGMVLDVDRDD